MAVGRFLNFQRLAARLLAKNGERSSHRRVSDTDTPGQPWRSTSSSEVATAVDAAWFEFDEDRVDGQLVRAGDRQVFVAGTALSDPPDPTTDYFVRVDGSRWQVVGPVRTIQPNEDLILYVAQLRRIG